MICLRAGERSCGRLEIREGNARNRRLPRLTLHGVGREFRRGFAWHRLPAWKNDFLWVARVGIQKSKIDMR